METILSIDTKKTLYKPFLIRINGKPFRVKEITLDGLDMAKELEKELMKGNTKAFREMLAMVIEGPMDEVGKLTISRLREVVQTAMGVAKTKEGKEQKKGPAPARAK
jgi:hypothetical protein